MFNASFGELKEQYYTFIHTLAVNLAGAIEDGEFRGESASGALVEEIRGAADGCGYAAHVPEACAALWVSKHGDAYFDSVGDANTFNPCSWAFFTIEQDIFDALEGMGYDPNNPQPLADDEEEE